MRIWVRWVTGRLSSGTSSELSLGLQWRMRSFRDTNHSHASKPPKSRYFLLDQIYLLSHVCHANFKMKMCIDYQAVTPSPYVGP